MDQLVMAVFTLRIHIPALFSVWLCVYCGIGAREPTDFVWVPVMKRMGIFKASSQQHEVSAIAVHPWVQTHFVYQKNLFLTK